MIGWGGARSSAPKTESAALEVAIRGDIFGQIFESVTYQEW